MQENCVRVMMDCKRAAGQDGGKCWGSSLARAVGEGICLHGDTEGEHREMGDSRRWEKLLGPQELLVQRLWGQREVGWGGGRQG